MFIAALVTVVKGKESLSCIVHGQMNEKQNVVYSYSEYYSALKRNRILIHFAMWMNPENIRLCETRQPPKGKYCMIPLIGGT